VGLLRGAFRPEAEVCAVRVLIRHRAELVQSASHHVQHMHQVLTPMNLQIHHVISDITGLTGLAIVDAILDGQRDAAALAKLRDPRVQADEETIRQSLLGQLETGAPVYAPTNRVSYIGPTRSRCDREIEQLPGDLAPWADPRQKPNRQTASVIAATKRGARKPVTWEPDSTSELRPTNCSPRT
jgi:hypothetical protein